MTTTDPSLPLAGVRVAITADRKGEELRAAFTRLGAEVVWGPTMRAVPPLLDPLLEQETRALLEADPTWFAVSTGSGLRAWLDAAGRAGLREDVERLLHRTRVVARGAKGHGALRGLGITPVHVSDTETMDDVCAWLGERMAGDDVLGAQVHGGEVIGTLDDLRPRVRRVLTVAPYRWVLPDDLAAAQVVVERLVAGEVDVLAQTSAPSARNLLDVAGAMGLRERLVQALREDVCVAVVGPVTARAFEEVDVGVDVMPGRARTGDLLRAVSSWARGRAPADAAASAAP
ncbi:MAG TPA: uroporphyrinogen-III synthase [Actinomycetales bacterium]|jgi:uroporphyrinogen-III synthase